jgi:hypothetical protein
MVIEETSDILQTRAGYWANMIVKTSIDRKYLDVSVLLLSTISEYFKIHFKGYIYIHD